MERRRGGSPSLSFWGPTSWKISHGHQHHCTSKKGSTAALLFKETQENQPVCRAAQSLLPLHPLSVLTYSIIAWYANRTEADIKTFQKIIGLPLPALDHIFKTRCRCKTSNILKDDTHPSHLLFSLLPSGRCYRTIKARTSRLKNSFRAELY